MRTSRAGPAPSLTGKDVTPSPSQASAGSLALEPLPESRHLTSVPVLPQERLSTCRWNSTSVSCPPAHLGHTLRKREPGNGVVTHLEPREAQQVAETQSIRPRVFKGDVEDVTGFSHAPFRWSQQPNALLAASVKWLPVRGPAQTVRSEDGAEGTLTARATPPQ